MSSIFKWLKDAKNLQMAEGTKLDAALNKQASKASTAMVQLLGYIKGSTSPQALLRILKALDRLGIAFPQQ